MKLAACGIDCGECASYKVTVSNDIQAAELLVDWYRGMGWIGQDEGAEAVLKKNPICYGCWDITEDCFWQCGCGTKDFRVCCTEKSIRHCGECGDFPCKEYLHFADMHEGHKKAMENLQSLRQTQ